MINNYPNRQTGPNHPRMWDIAQDQWIGCGEQYIEESTIFTVNLKNFLVTSHPPMLGLGQRDGHRCPIPSGSFFCLCDIPYLKNRNGFG